MTTAWLSLMNCTTFPAQTFPKWSLRSLSAFVGDRQLLQWVWPWEGKPLVFGQCPASPRAGGIRLYLDVRGGASRLSDREMQFQASMKVSHHWMSLLICWFRLTLWFWPPLTEVRSYMCRTKHLPGLTTFAACCSFPANNCISFLVADFLPCQSRSSALSSCILCSDKDSCIATKSIFMPRISSSVAGPSIFSSARGTPKQWQSSMSVLRSVPHFSRPGPPRMM